MHERSAHVTAVRMSQQSQASPSGTYVEGTKPQCVEILLIHARRKADDCLGLRQGSTLLAWAATAQPLRIKAHEWGSWGEGLLV